MIDKKSNLLISPENPSSTTSVYCAPPLKSLNVETPVSLSCHLDINIYMEHKIPLYKTPYNSHFSDKKDI